MKRAICLWTAALAILGLATAVALASDPRIPQEQETPVIVRRARVGEVSSPLSRATLISNPANPAKERAIFDIELPAILDSVRLDFAELVMTVSSVDDPIDPLILAVAPVTDRSALEELAEVADWTGEDEGSNMKYSTLTSFDSTEDGAEVRLDVTPIVELWLSGRIPNRGLVVRALSEEKSTFKLTQTGIYDGGDARLEIMYSTRHH